MQMLQGVKWEAGGSVGSSSSRDTQSDSSDVNGNFPHYTAARLLDENTRLSPYVRTVYTAEAPAAAPASHGEGTRCQQAKPRQTNTSRPLSLSLRRTVTGRRRRPAYLRLWPALSFFPFGLLFLAWMAITAGVRLRLSTGKTDVRVRVRGRV